MTMRVNYDVRATPLPPFWRGVVQLVRGMGVVSGVGLIALMILICVDVLFRRCGAPITGMYDWVRIVGSVAMAFALPWTTAKKGHVAIEYFFQRLNGVGRLVVDSLMRGIVIALFVVVMCACARYGYAMWRGGEVSTTVGVPVFWIFGVLAFVAMVTVLIVIFHLVYPGRELLR